MWPVLMDEEEWDESLWNETDFHRFSVDFFIDSDLKHTSKRVLYVGMEFHRKKKKLNFNLITD